MEPRSEREKLKLAHDICDFLNELLATDAKAVHGLVEHRVVCNDALTYHPTVQVATDEGLAPMVGMLGILNGFVGVDAASWGYIVAVFPEGEAKIERFEVRSG